ncbi:hypothetical protein HYT53_04630 [Candidatus Woesearchaeota archaeon]|nr:hypothetical protein [Candidatus Woesearchaeota archaeon]
MKLAISLSILILFLPAALAETEIFSGKVITNSDKSIDGGIFRFQYDDVADKVFVQTPTTNLISANGECKSNDVFRVCINSANFSHKNITTYVYYYEIDATIYKLTGSLSASSKATLSSLLQGEPTDLEVTVTNPTDFEITGILFSYDLAPFYILEAKGCELNGKRLIWEGTLKPKYDKTCTAKISTDKEGKYNLAGNLSYFNGYDTERIMTNASVVTVLPKQLKVSYFMDKDILVGEPFYTNLSLQNLHSSEEINAKFTIKLPSHVSLIKDKPALEKDGRTLRHSSLLLKPAGSMNYSLYLEKNSQGTEPINYKFEYAIKGISDVIENSTFVDEIITQQKTEPAEKKQEKSNDTIASAAQEPVQSQQMPDKNATADAAAENKTAAEPVAIEAKPKSDKKILITASASTAFLVILLVIFRLRKGKRESKELAERIRQKLETDKKEALNEIQEKVLKKE